MVLNRSLRYSFCSSSSSENGLPSYFNILLSTFTPRRSTKSASCPVALFSTHIIFLTPLSASLNRFKGNGENTTGCTTLKPSFSPASTHTPLLEPQNKRAVSESLLP